MNIAKNQSVPQNIRTKFVQLPYKRKRYFTNKNKRIGFRTIAEALPKWTAEAKEMLEKETERDNRAYFLKNVLKLIYNQLNNRGGYFGIQKVAGTVMMHLANGSKSF